MLLCQPATFHRPKAGGLRMSDAVVACSMTISQLEKWRKARERTASAFSSSRESWAANLRVGHTFVCWLQFWYVYHLSQELMLDKIKMGATAITVISSCVSLPRLFYDSSVEQQLHPWAKATFQSNFCWPTQSLLQMMRIVVKKSIYRHEGVQEWR